MKETVENNNHKLNQLIWIKFNLIHYLFKVIRILFINFINIFNYWKLIDFSF